MCSDNKLACLNRCCQLLHPASVVNFVWFTDDKLSKCYCCSPKKCPKRSRSRTWEDSLTFTRSSKTMHHQMLDGWVSDSRDTWRHTFRVTWGCNGEQFFTSEPDEVYLPSRVTSHRGVGSSLTLVRQIPSSPLPSLLSTSFFPPFVVVGPSFFPPFSILPLPSIFASLPLEVDALNPARGSSRAPAEIEFGAF